MGFFDEVGSFFKDAASTGAKLWNGTPIGNGARPLSIQNKPAVPKARPKPAPYVANPTARLQAQSRDHKQAMKEIAARPDPYGDLMDFAGQFGGMVGGSGGSPGSPGNGAAIAALVDQINKNKEAANTRYQTNKSQITDMYGQLRDSLAPNAGLTAARYNTAINQAKVGGQGIAAATVAQQNKQDDQRNVALNSLGIDPTVVASDENAATQRGLNNLTMNNASWGNLQAVLSNAQQSRDQLDVQGATDAGILANRELSGNYEDYLRDLDNQIAQAQSQYVAPTGGSGGSPAHYSNPMMDTINDAVLQKMLIDAGVKHDPYAPKPGPDMGNPAAYLAALGTGQNEQGRALSGPEILAGIANGADPMGALMARKYFG